FGSVAGVEAFSFPIYEDARACPGTRADQHSAHPPEGHDRDEPRSRPRLVARDGTPRWRGHDRDSRPPNDAHAAVLLAPPPPARGDHSPRAARAHAPRPAR